MNGLVNRALQGFLIETYGRGVWDKICRDADLGFDEFEAMLQYAPDIAGSMAEAAAKRLDKSPAQLLEDVGTFLIAHPSQARIRRLLRFGGGDFREFLFSLEELRGRAQMALPGLDIPEFSLAQIDPNSFELTVKWYANELSPIVIGAVRAMADEYGALVLIDEVECASGDLMIGVELLDNSFAEGRSFRLGEATP